MHVYAFKLKLRTCNLPMLLFIKSYAHLICIQQSATIPSSEDPPCICWREAVSPPSDRRPRRSTLALPILPCLKLGTASPLLATNSARNKLGRYVTSCIHAFVSVLMRHVASTPIFVIKKYNLTKTVIKLYYLTLL